MNRKFPETLTDLQCELLEHAKNGRSDAGFRALIMLDQIGGLVRHFTHDRVENPTSRPHGSRKTEIGDAGHAIVQLITYCALRDIDLQEAVEMALGNLREKDFVACPSRKSQGGNLRGVAACTAKGGVEARAWVCDDHTAPWPSVWDEPLILVIPHAEADARLKHFEGIITDHGGMFCHAGIISRENGIPCIVGTGDATKRIQTGDLIRMSTTDGTITIVEG